MKWIFWLFLFALVGAAYILGQRGAVGAAMLMPIIPGRRWKWAVPRSTPETSTGFGRFFAVSWLTTMLAVIIGMAWLVFAPPARAQTIEIPEYSFRLRVALQSAATEAFGIDAPVSRLAGQIHQESNWQPKAASPYAQGLAQFTPATARWLPSVCPDIGPPDPWDASWSIRALVCYDAYLYARTPPGDECNRWAFVLSDYNGGQSMRIREQTLTKQHDRNPDLWWSNVETYSARSRGAYTENRTYVRRILLVLEPIYLQYDWGGKGACVP